MSAAIANGTKSLVQAFAEAVTEFSKMLLLDFPDCEKLRRTWDKWDCTILQCSTDSIRTALLAKMMQLFHANLERFYARVHAHNASVVDEINHPLFTDLDLRPKFDAYATEERDCVFAHIDAMCAIVATYVHATAVPGS